MQRALLVASLFFQLEPFLLPFSYSISSPQAFIHPLYYSHSTMTECSLKSTAGDGDKKTCIPCESLDTSALLTREQVQQSIQESIPLWTLQENINNNDVMCLSRSFVAKNFQAALDCINAMGVIAEREGHHPDFHLTNYRHVEICLYTHSLSGITQNDVDMCAMLDREVDILYSPKWLKEHPEANK